MIRHSKETDERREAGPLECWCLHGAVGSVSDFRPLAKSLANSAISTRSVDLWRFLESESLPITSFGHALNADAGGETFRGTGRSLLGYSMGGRLALHSLLEKDHPWQAAVIISANPGLESDSERISRSALDRDWATKAFTALWPDFLDQWNSQPVLGGEIREPEASRQLVSRRREIARSFVDWSLGAQLPLWDRLAGIRIPVLWVAGENDAKFRALAERAASLTPKGVLEIIPGSGHRVPWERPITFAERVARFLKTGE
jgi:2-succinyl-6-hydroxy-2,4-cyclohexadiene-1-carboxylate synthase